jgi:hypothetical protein
VRSAISRGKGFPAVTIDATWPLAAGEQGLEAAINRICGEAEKAVLEGARMIILSDRTVDHAKVPVPMLLATGAVHHHLIRGGETDEGIHYLRNRRGAGRSSNRLSDQLRSERDLSLPVV